VAIDLAKELADALRRPEVQDLFRDLVTDAVRQHLLLDPLYAGRVPPSFSSRGSPRGAERHGPRR
jgi:hypothetical protein